MLLGLTSGQKIGLVAVAAAFILFALASSFLLPRRNPDFPGRGLRLFLVTSIAMFVAMVAAVVVLAREEHLEPVGGQEAAETVIDETETTDEAAGARTDGGTETEGGEDEQSGQTTGEDSPGEGNSPGDAAAGREVFASAGCGGCHALRDSQATGNVGPNLDESQPSFELSVNRVTNGKPPMPAYKDQLSEQQIRDVSAYVVAATSG